MSQSDKIPPALLAAVIKRPSLPEEYPQNRKFQGIPSIAALPGNGGLFATWYAGGTGEGPDNYVIIARSHNDGLSWEDPFFIIRHEDKNIRCFDPNIWCDPEGKLWIFWAQSYSLKVGNTSDGRAGVWASYSSNPNGEAPQWSPPCRIANGVMMNKPVILSNGEWAFPTALWRGNMEKFGIQKAPEELQKEVLSNITISPDQGKTFFFRGGADVPERSFDENMIVEKKDGTLQMLVRTDYGVGESLSRDMGKTWSPGRNSGISSPNSRFYVGRLASGNLLLVHNEDDSSLDYKQRPWRPRRNLSARISLDDGSTWQGGSLLLDERVNTSYPDAFQAEDGSIYIIYDYERYKGGTVLMAKITQEDILAGKIVSENSFLKRVISFYPWEAKEN